MPVSLTPLDPSYTLPSYGCTPGNIVASVNLSTTKKNECATSYGCAPGNMVASVNLATPKKEIARPPIVALLAIWLHSLTMVASINLSTTIIYCFASSYGCAPGNMVASVNLATPKKEVA